jgi:hypothetical protein
MMMKSELTKRTDRWELVSILPLMLLSALLVNLFSCTAAKDTKSPEMSESGKPLDGGFFQGLSVIYFDGFYRNINQMPTGTSAKYEGKPGKPIPYLNHRFGQGLVFDSGKTRGIGMDMNGFIHFPDPGTYRFKARSNDGIRLYIDGKMLFEDPKVHSDRFSPVGEITVESAGKRPVRILYFQRKGTATLEMYWMTPGKKDFVIVPAKAYSHLPAKK